MTAYRMRPGLRKIDQNPHSSRSLGVRFGARWRARRKTLAEDDRTSSLEICAFERRDELHIRYVLPRETVSVRDEQIDSSGRRTSKLDRVGRLDGAVGPNCCITRRAGRIKGKNRGDLPNCRFMIANGRFALLPGL